MRGFHIITLAIAFFFTGAGSVYGRPSKGRSSGESSPSRLQARVQGPWILLVRQKPDKTFQTTARKRLAGPIVQLLRSGRYLFAACGQAGLSVVEIRSSGYLRLAATVSGIGPVVGLAIEGRVLVVSVGRYQFRAYDVSSPANLQPLDLDRMNHHLKQAARRRAGRLKSKGSSAEKTAARPPQNLPKLLDIDGEPGKSTHTRRGSSRVGDHTILPFTDKPARSKPTRRTTRPRRHINSLLDFNEASSTSDRPRSGKRKAALDDYSLMDCSRPTPPNREAMKRLPPSDIMLMPMP